MAERVLTQRDLNRALLARQLLLGRSRLPLVRALEQVAGIQAQYAPSTYVGLVSRLERFTFPQLDRALERRRAVQGTLMRSTIHVVSARDYWPFAAGIGRTRREWWERTHRRRLGPVDVDAAAEAVRAALGDGTGRREELVALCRELAGDRATSLWNALPLDLVRVPPSGTWGRRRADLFATAESWLGPPDVDEAEGLDHLLRRYLAGFGPARLAEAADWAGVPVTGLRPSAERLRLRRFRDEAGGELLDVPRAPLPGGDVAVPPRFLPTWDATLLVHARRTQILPEPFRPLVFSTRTPHSVSTFLVDGAVAGAWRTETARGRASLVLEPFDGLPRGARRPLEDEGRRLLGHVEPDAVRHAVRVA